MRNIFWVIMINIGLANSITNTIIQEKIMQAVEKYSAEYKIEKALIQAIIKRESDYKPFSIRHEKHLETTKWYNHWLDEYEKKDKLAYSSMGAMQVLFGVAKSYGFDGIPEHLLIIDVNIKYGCIHLKNLIKRYYNLHDVISAYNQGTPRKINNRYINQEYVNFVMKYYIKYNGKVK